MGNYVFYGTEDLISEQPIDLKDYLLEIYLEKQLKSVSFAVKQQPCLSPNWGQKKMSIYCIKRQFETHWSCHFFIFPMC